MSIKREQAEAVANAFNEIFELRLAWHADGLELGKISDEDISRLSELSRVIVSGLEQPEIVSVASIICSKRFLDADAQELFLRNGTNVATSLLEQIPNNVSSAAMEAFLDNFYRIERTILSSAGFNQGSIALIIDELKKHDKIILQNFFSTKNLSEPTYRSVLATFSKNMQVIGASVHERTKKLRALRVERKRLVGLATMWGNFIFYLSTKDKTTSVMFSGIAGATVSAILPSGQRKRRDPLAHLEQRRRASRKKPAKTRG